MNFQDFPTVNQVYQRLRESRIQPIFAVSQYGRKTFMVSLSYDCMVFDVADKRLLLLALILTLYNILLVSITLWSHTSLFSSGNPFPS